MCGRYRLSPRKQIIEEYFGSAPWDDDWSPRYNIAPTQPVPVIRQHPKEPVRQVSLMGWGLIPHSAKDQSIATCTINAKSETAATKPAFRDPLKYRRCLIPADGFYEWKGNGNVEATVLLRSEQSRPVRVRGTLGRLEECGSAMGEDVLDFDHGSQLSCIGSPRPNASDPWSR